jgi:hypothetical protein
MTFDSKKTPIAKACAPAATSGQLQQQQPRVWSLAQLGPGLAGWQAATLSGIAQRQVDESGNYQGQTFYAVVGNIQHEPGVARILRTFEFRAAITTDRQTGLVYRMLPYAAAGINSWLRSAETSMYSLVGTWGRVTSDRNAGAYCFERLNLPARVNNNLLDIDDLIDELLADYVIDTLDHPALQRLLNQSSPQGTQGLGLTTSAVIDEGDHADYVY